MSAGFPLQIEGAEPVGIVRPATEEACVEAVLRAASEGAALVPHGGRTALFQGNRLRTRRWLALDMRGLEREIEFSPEDMVVTASAGTTLSALQALLMDSGQFLPLDPPYPAEATLGGIVAANWTGLWRPAYGAPRDRLLALRVVLADGSVARAGAKVVKNVAGYDLCKLFAGSWGTLGAITEVTFKTNPLPPARAQLHFAAPSLASALQAAESIHRARLQPTYLVISHTDSCAIAVGLHGSEESVAWQAGQIHGISRDAGLTPSESGPSEEALRHAMAGGETLTGRISARPTDLAAIAQRIRSLTGDALLLHFPSGIVEFRVSAPPSSALLRSMWEAVPAGANLVWTIAPAEWRALIEDVWGRPGEGIALMRQIKQALDPAGLFSPGRFLGGI